jgi:hypothetical protein
MLQTLHLEAELYADIAYTEYEIEDWLKEEKRILLKVQRKYISKRPDTNEQTQRKLKIKKLKGNYNYNNIKKIFPRTIHGGTFQGSLLKFNLLYLCRTIYPLFKLAT